MKCTYCIQPAVLVAKATLYGPAQMVLDLCLELEERMDDIYKIKDAIMGHADMLEKQNRNF